MVVKMWSDKIDSETVGKHDLYKGLLRFKTFVSI